MARGFLNQGLNPDSPAMKYAKQGLYELGIRAIEKNDTKAKNCKESYKRPAYGTEAYKKWKKERS